MAPWGPRPFLCATLLAASSLAFGFLGCKSDELCSSNECEPAGVGDAGSGGDSGKEPSGGTHAGAGPQAACLGKQPSPTSGGPCGCSADCDEGELCASEVETGAPGGICVRTCDVDPCPAGRGCVQLNAEATVCQILCQGAQDCGPGRVCQDLFPPLKPGDSLYCTPFCQSDDDCPALGHCDAYTGLCGDFGKHPGDGITGAPCASPNDCKSGACLPPEQTPGGSCFGNCSLSKQGCPDGAVCDLADADYGFCVPGCKQDDDCRDGYACAHAYDVKAFECRAGGRIGAACTSADDCADGDCIVSKDYPGGYCTAHCSLDAPCPDDKLCSDDVDGRCLAHCATPQDCRAGYECVNVVDVGGSVCWPKGL